MEFEQHLRLLTLVSSLFAGISLLIVARHLRVPAVAVLLLGGIALGPEFAGLIQPEALGGGFGIIVSLAVAVILLEGGLTLDVEGFQKAPKMIWRLLTIGGLVTWFGTALSIYLLFDFPIAFCLLAGSLVIVTGPTVITPLLQRINVKQKIHHVLHWEGVLIDPIGVFIAVLCFELISVDDRFLSIGQFGLRLLLGFGLGGLGGLLANWMLNNKWVHAQYANIFVLAAALFLFGVSDMILTESGILTVVVMGFILGAKKPPMLQNIQKFKLELTEMAIGLVFILLSASLSLDQFAILGWKGIALVAITILVVRPLGIALCSYNTTLQFREKLFLSWMAPRGIVAGFMASLFALQLSKSGHENASFLEVFTFSIIAVTVVFQGLSAGAVASWLGVKADDREGWLIVGAHFFARRIARFITRTTKAPCILMDLNADAINEARAEGFTALQANALNDDVLPPEQLPLVGNMLALTDNRRLNRMICEKWSNTLGPQHVFCWGMQQSDIDAGEAPRGKAVWNTLPKPSQIAYDLKHAEAILIRADAQRVSSKHVQDTVPLILSKGTQAKLDPEKIDEQTEGEALLLRMQPHQLPFFAHPETIVKLNSDSLENLFSQLLDLVTPNFPELPRDEILEALLEREHNFPTTLSHGVAVPHTYSDALKEPLCLIAQVPEGIKWHEQSEELSQLVFLLLTPVRDREIHLLLLAEVAKIASDPDFVQQLVRAESPEAVMQHLLHNDSTEKTHLSSNFRTS